MRYLLINIGSPKSLNSTIIRIRREYRGTRCPNLVNVFNDDHGLTDGLVTMNQNWYFLMNRVGLEEKLTLGPKCLFKKVIVHRFDIKCNPRPQHMGWATHPEPWHHSLPWVLTLKFSNHQVLQVDLFLCVSVCVCVVGK